MKKIETVQELLTEINDHGAMQCDIEVYTYSGGMQYEIVDAYVEDNIFCFDIQRVET